MLHAAILLECANGKSDNAVAIANGVNRHTVALCIRKFLQFGIDAALGKLPRPGKSRRIPDDAIAWVLHCACQKPKDLGYSYELWTYALLQSHEHEQQFLPPVPLRTLGDILGSGPYSGLHQSG